MRQRAPRYRSRLAPKPAPRPRSSDITGWVPKRDLSLPLPHNVLLPAAYDDADIASLQALRNGTASQEQQRRALEWMVWASGVYGRAFHSDPFEHAYASGRRELGQEIVKLLNTKTSRASTTEQG